MLSKETDRKLRRAFIEHMPKSEQKRSLRGPLNNTAIVMFMISVIGMLLALAFCAH